MRLGGSSLVFDDGDDKHLREGDAGSTKSEYANVEAGDKIEKTKGKKLEYKKEKTAEQRDSLEGLIDSKLEI